MRVVENLCLAFWTIGSEFNDGSRTSYEHFRRTLDLGDQNSAHKLACLLYFWNSEGTINLPPIPSHAEDPYRFQHCQMLRQIWFGDIEGILQLRYAALAGSD
jgi:hypothetical protein